LSIMMFWIARPAADAGQRCSGGDLTALF